VPRPRIDRFHWGKAGELERVTSKCLVPVPSEPKMPFAIRSEVRDKSAKSAGFPEMAPRFRLGGGREKKWKLRPIIYRVTGNDCASQHIIARNLGTLEDVPYGHCPA
jgi:hypothetical protein